VNEIKWRALLSCIRRALLMIVGGIEDFLKD
jgi:hypothetical protein